MSALPQPTIVAGDTRPVLLELNDEIRTLMITSELVEDLLDTTQAARLSDTPASHSSRGNETPVPGRIAAHSLAAEIRATAIFEAKFVRRRLTAAGLCPLVRRLDHDPTLVQCLEHLLATCAPAPERILRPVLVDVLDISERAGRFVDGDTTAELGDCPHCHLPTLVAHQYPKDPDQDVVICGRDRSTRNPRDRRYAPCRCKSITCACRLDPIGFRHRWYRALGNRSDGWNALAYLITKENRS